MIENKALQFWQRYKKHMPKDLPLVNKLNIPQSTLSSWKSKCIFPRVDIACEIAELLGVTVEYLVTGKDGNNSSCSVEAMDLAVILDDLNDEGKSILKIIAMSLKNTHPKIINRIYEKY